MLCPKSHYILHDLYFLNISVDSQIHLKAIVSKVVTYFFVVALESILELLLIFLF